MRSFSHQKFNSNFIVAHLGGGENRDSAQLPSMGSASISKIRLTKTAMQTTMTAPRNIEGGRGNPFRLGDNPPQPFVVFLRLPFFDNPILDSRFNFMMGLRGQLSKLVAPSRGISTPCKPITNTVESICDGFTHFRLGIST